MNLINQIVKLEYSDGSIVVGKVKAIPDKENILFFWVMDGNEEFHQEVIAFINNATISVI